MSEIPGDLKFLKSHEWARVEGNGRVTVGISGTGGGFKKFCRGETDISDASRPITKKEMEDCKAAGIEYIEMPVSLRSKYQYFTQAEMGKLRAAGYAQAFTSLEDGIRDYVQGYLAKG